MPNGTTIGVWIPEDSDLVDRFDITFSGGPGSYSRSKELSEAMELHITVENVLEEINYGFGSGRQRRHFVRQALLAQARREASEA